MRVAARERGGQPVRLWTGKQIISVLLRPNKSSNVVINLEAKCRTYSSNKDMCPNDGCTFGEKGAAPTNSTLTQGRNSVPAFWDILQTWSFATRR